MMKKFGKKMLTSLMALTMVFGVFDQTSVYAAEEPLSFHADSTYAVVSADKGKAINIKTVGWQTHTTVDGIYIQDGNKVSNNTLLKFTPTDDSSGLEKEQIKVKIEYVGIEGQSYPMRSEAGNTFVFADGDKRTDSYEYIITKTADNKGLIQDTTMNYYFSIKENGEIERTNVKDNAVEFTFVENPTVTDFTYYIEHKASGKYVKANGVGSALTVDGEAVNGIIGDDLRWTSVWGEYNGRSVTFNSKATPDSRWQGGNTDKVTQIAGSGHGGWESIRVVPNGNGTISFKDTADGKFFTVKDNKIVKIDSTTSSDENGEFIIHSLFAPEKATDVTVSDVEDDMITVSWTAPVDTFYTGYKVVATPVIGAGSVVTSDETSDTTMTLTGLQKGTQYTITVQTVNGENPYSISDGVDVQTKNGKRPAKVTDITTSKETNGIKVKWAAVETATSYDVYRAESAYSEYVKIADSVTETNYIDTNLNEKGVYYNYYKVVAKNENGDSNISDAFSSLETEMFGENVIIFAETDKVEKINEICAEIYALQSDINADAQFNTNRFTIYFKPGNYETLNNIQVGFYTQVAGLGRTPYEVRLNNMETPAYLSNGNTTCNFWRSAENLSVIETGNAQGKSSLYNFETFTWAVAQAAPLRRIYSTRKLHYDWNGNASGGYVADSYIDNDAETWNQQQFYTRNSEITGNVTGGVINMFYQGVIANNLTEEALGGKLINNSGYTNWQIPTDNNAQQHVTSIKTTPIIREKPFIFLDNDGEYKIFVPALKKDSSGISWGEGKENNGMGAGKILSLDEFYIAKEGDTAKTINEQLEAGKNIFFTPGVYHAEEVINVEKEGTIVLGTGMASIIPDNKDAAMRVADVDGVTIAGLIFDAGAGSKYLLQIGESGADADHSQNPTLLADLFFRIGGTTNELTKADIALEITSNNVIGDHFWIWRADHGAGVAWDGNVSTNGLIVNGDNVTCYALFNEHFEEYNTLWNGENGATYFYQNETCYDPFDQSYWKSHNGSVDGYASYKVANGVKKHYAVGLGIYNVLIYTGGTPGKDGNPGTLGDSSKVSVALENAIEVPNSEGVLIENACIQTFCNDKAAPQYTRHIINGVGQGVEQGTNPNGSSTEGWSKKFLISYNNGTAVVGKTLYGGNLNPNDVTETIKDVKQLGDDNLDFKGLKTLIDQAQALNENDYTAESWATLAEILEIATKAYNNENDYYKYAYADSDHVIDKTITLKGLNTIKAELKTAIESLEKAADKTVLKDLHDTHVGKDSKDYTAESWDVFEKAMNTAETVLANGNATQEEVDNAYKALDAAIKGLKAVTPVDSTDSTEPTDPEDPKDSTDPAEPTEPTTPVNPANPTEPTTPTDSEKMNTVNNTNPAPSTPNKVKTGDMSLVAPYATLAVCALGAYVTIRKRKNG